VAKSASAFVRAFLAILVLELEDMVVRLVRPPKLAMAIVGQFACLGLKHKADISWPGQVS